MIIRKNKNHSIKITKALFLFLLVFFLQGFSQERFRRTPPSAYPLSPLNLPELETASLSNGLLVSVLPRKDLPFIYIDVLFQVGEAFSPDRFQGLATLSTSMMGRGTMRYSQEDVDEYWASIGGNYSLQTFVDYSRLSSFFLPEYLNEAMEILSHMILGPSFSRRGFEGAKRDLFYDLVRRNNNPDFLAKRLLLQTLFQEHPYRKIALYRESLADIDRIDSQNFYNKFFTPNNSRIIFIGDLNLSTVTKLTSHYLQSWTEKSLEHYSFDVPKANKKRKICLINHPHSRDITIYLGNMIFPQSSQDIFPYLVLSHILGGTPYSRLFITLREEKGYAYYAFSNMEIFKMFSVFYIQARVRPEVLNSSIKEIFSEVNKIIKNEIPNYEIEQAKSYLIGHFPLEIEHPHNLAFRLATLNIYGFGREFWNDYYSNIMKVTPKDVFRVAQQSLLLTPVIALAGDEKLLAPMIKDMEMEVYDRTGQLLYTIYEGGKK